MKSIICLLGCLLTAVVHGAELATVTAVEETVAEEYRLDGVIEAIHQSTVSAQTSGRIVELPYDVDDYVEKGAVIVRFRGKEQEARFQRAQAALEEAQARAREAEKEYARIEEVYGRQLISKAELDRAKANFDAAQARLQQARAALEEAREQYEFTLVRAPYPGIVVERHVELGETAQVGQPLMTGLSLEHLRAVVSVPQQFISAVREYQQARVLLPGGDSVTAASLRIFPYADEATHTFRVRVNLPEGQHGVYPGMLVKVAFVHGERPQLLIPERAVARRSEVTGVYVREGDRLRFRLVRLGTPLADGRVPVLAGVSAGEQVVLDPVAAARAYKTAPAEADHE